MTKTQQPAPESADPEESRPDFWGRLDIDETPPPPSEPIRPFMVGSSRRWQHWHRPTPDNEEGDAA